MFYFIFQRRSGTETAGYHNRDVRCLFQNEKGEFEYSSQYINKWSYRSVYLFDYPPVELAKKHKGIIGKVTNENYSKSDKIPVDVFWIGGQIRYGVGNHKYTIKINYYKWKR